MTGNVSPGPTGSVLNYRAASALQNSVNWAQSRSGFSRPFWLAPQIGPARGYTE